MENILRAGTLKISIAKEALYVVVFSALAVYAPYIVHIFGGAEAGKIFLPMPFFVLLTGLLLGWRAGLATAIVAPLISFSISGMPAIQTLPFITLQLAVLGIISGILRKKTDAFFSLIGAIISGWIAIGIAILIFSKMNAVNYVFSGIKDGLPGIILELTLIPLVVILINKYLSREKEI